MMGGWGVGSAIPTSLSRICASLKCTFRSVMIYTDGRVVRVRNRVVKVLVLLKLACIPQSIYCQIEAKYSSSATIARCASSLRTYYTSDIRFLTKFGCQFVLIQILNPFLNFFEMRYGFVFLCLYLSGVIFTSVIL